MTLARLPRSPTAAEAAVLHHPDRRSAWAVLVTAQIAGGLAVDIDRVTDRHPLASARWDGKRWLPGSPPRPTVGPPDLSPFNLGLEGPLRVSTQPEAGLVHVVGHHSAFDGLALARTVAILIDADAGFGELPTQGAAAPTAGPAGRSRTKSAAWALLRPNASVSPTTKSAGEFRAWRPSPRDTSRLTARLADAATRSLSERGLDPARGPVGISVATGGSTQLINDASFTRLRVRPDEGVADLVTTAVRSDVLPPELRHPSRLLWLLGPIANRLSDTFLVSNLGRVDIPGVSRLEFYPVARGRSAVAFGAVGVKGGPSTVTIRSLYLSPEDATAILDDVVRRLESDGPSDGG